MSYVRCDNEMNAIKRCYERHEMSDDRWRGTYRQAKLLQHILQKEWRLVCFEPWTTPPGWTLGNNLSTKAIVSKSDVEKALAEVLAELDGTLD